MNQNEDHALSDKALRQALLRGLDKETYCNTLLEGGATAGKAPVPPTLDFGFDDLNDENSYDPDSAKKILEDAGYKDVDGDGYVETPDGDPLVLDFVIYTSRAELGVYAQAAQASLKEIGINVNLNTVSYETLLDMRDSGQYDLLISINLIKEIKKQSLHILNICNHNKLNRERNINILWCFLIHFICFITKC